VKIIKINPSKYKKPLFTSTKNVFSTDIFYTLMSNSFYNVWIHAVFATKDRQHLISLDLEEVLYPFLFDEFSQLGCKLKIVNGLSDHIHCLFMLDAKKSYAEVMKQIKGTSSHYINEHNFIFEKFAWQKGYAVFSVSQFDVEFVYEFIKKQKIKQESLEEEGIKL
jgi:REP element-mobilizing transposase RayT